MRTTTLKLSSRRDGVLVGVLLTLLVFGDLIHRAGDVEKNPGPPKQDKAKQTRLTSESGFSRRESNSGILSEEKSSMMPESVLKNIETMFTSLSTKFDELGSDVRNLNSKFHKLSGDIKGVIIIIILN